MSWGNQPDNIDWVTLLETLMDNVKDDDQRREMWDLINVDDLPGLTVNQLESGMATVTRSEDFFDCFPAVKQAYKTTKDISREPIAEQDNDADDEKSKGSRMLDFEEFKTFLQILRQYYIFCQNFGNNELDINMKVTKSSLVERNTKQILQDLLGDDFVDGSTLDENDELRTSGSIGFGDMMEWMMGIYTESQHKIKRKQEEAVNEEDVEAQQ